MKSIIGLVLAGLAVANASCANDCSGHGSCNVYSSCDCYRNWMGADCSERVCYFGLAFVDTPLGDINADGLVSGADDINTRQSNQEVQEIYPWYAGWGGTHYQVKVRAENDNSKTSKRVMVTKTGSAVGEAHFYKECSNKGICDRSTGKCECFPGFAGEGCTRTACPNDCSGHGVCQRMSEKVPSYRAWDRYATQSCTCDSGYFGADCSLRKCPHGDDPVTKYEGFTRITLKDAASAASDADWYDTDTCSAAPSASASTSGNRIWSHNIKATGAESSKCTGNNCSGWNPWYSYGAATPGVATMDYCDNDATMSTSGDCTGTWQNTGTQFKWSSQTNAYGVAGSPQRDACAHHLQSMTSEHSSICQQQPVAFSSSIYTTTAIHGYTMTARGSHSDASGTMTLGGCEVTSSSLSCSNLDFWSLYLKDVAGTFQTGDALQIAGTQKSGGTGSFTFDLCNYIKEVGMYYAAANSTDQDNEQQVLTISFATNTDDRFTNGTPVSDTLSVTRMEGFFSLNFEDEMGDTWTTEAIAVNVNQNGNRSSDAMTVSAGFDFNQHDDEAVGGNSVGSPRITDLASRIEHALESLPNNVAGDVQVVYRPPSTGMNSTPLGAGKRSFSISFLDNTGNIPRMTVNYSLTDKVGTHVQSNAACGGGDDALSCITVFGGKSAGGMKAMLTSTGGVSDTIDHQVANIKQLANHGAGAVIIEDHTEAPVPVGSASFGKDGTRENEECSNRGICDYSTGNCQCFPGYTNEDCSQQNSLATG